MAPGPWITPRVKEYIDEIKKRVEVLEKRNQILEQELIKRYHLCESYSATPCSILLAVANSVAEANKTPDRA